MIRNIDTNLIYGIIEDVGCSKLSFDFRYMFEQILSLGDQGRLDGDDKGFLKKYDRFIVITYDRSASKKRLSACGLHYRKDYLFAEDFFYLLDDWKKCRIAYKAYPENRVESLKAAAFGFAAKHHCRHALEENPVLHKFYYMFYLLFGLLESFPQIFSKGNLYERYDHICFYKASDAVMYIKDHPSVKDKVTTVEEVRAHCQASSYMKTVYYDRRQNDCMCDMPFETLWIGKDGTSRLCDCPDFLDISCGNIGVTDIKKVWDSPLARIIRMSAADNSYSFCNKKMCRILAEGNEKTEALKARNVKTREHPLKINIANDYACNLCCPSCRTKLYCKNDEKTESAINACNDALIESGWLESAEKLLVGGGGEAFLSENYKKIIYGGSVKRKSIIIMTNGTLFSDKEWEKLEGRYEHISFLVSVDAITRQTYEKVRCGGNFERLMKNMEYLSHLRRENKVCSVKAIMIVQKNNYQEIPAFIKWAEEMGFDAVNLSHIRNWGTYDDAYFYENVSMLDRNGKMKKELSLVMENPACKDPIVSISWKA